MPTPTKSGTLPEALLEFQSKLVTVGKTAENPFFHSTYAPLPEILKAIQPVLKECGLVLTQFPSHIDGKPALKTSLFHTHSKEVIEETTPLVLTKADPQAHGSAITYMRRYALASVLQIVIDEDDDGQKASNAEFNTAYVQDTQKANPAKIIKEKHLSGDPQVDPETFKELCFLGTNLNLSKEVAKKVWDDLYQLGVYRGKYNPETKAWTGTDIAKKQIPVIVGLFADAAGYGDEAKTVLIQQFTGDEPSDLDEYSSEVF